MHPLMFLANANPELGPSVADYVLPAFAVALYLFVMGLYCSRLRPAHPGDMMGVLYWGGCLLVYYWGFPEIVAGAVWDLFRQLDADGSLDPRVKDILIVNVVILLFVHRVLTLYVSNDRLKFFRALITSWVFGYIIFSATVMPFAYFDRGLHKDRFVVANLELNITCAVIALAIDLLLWSRSPNRDDHLATFNDDE